MLGIGGTPEKKIERHLKKIKQGYAQPDYRRASMDALLEMDTPESYFALCKRFAANANSAYWDEEEKKWLVDTFADLGDKAVGPLKKFVLENDNVNYPLRALERLLSEDEMTGFLVEALTSRPPDDYRSSRGKLELIDHLGQRPFTPQLVEVILPYLRDHSDDVICKTIEVFEDREQRDRGPDLFGTVYDDTMSARVQRRAAEAIEKLGIQSEAELESLPDAVQEDYVIDGRTLRRNRPRGDEE